MIKYIVLLPVVLTLAACSGNYPSWTLPTWWPGTHNVPPAYVNQDCIVNAPMEYGLDAQKRALNCTGKSMTELFK